MSGGGSNARQYQLQEDSLTEQRRANNMQLEFLAKQTAALEKSKLPAYKPPSPPPTPGTSGADYAGTQARIAANRRFGYADTVKGGMRLAS